MPHNPPKYGRWLVLMSKRKGDPVDPSADRPLCILDTSGKLFERLLKLTAAIENGGELCGRQYGFQPVRSKIGVFRKRKKRIHQS